MNKHKDKALEKVKNQKEQELAKREELEDKNKVELPSLPKVLEKAKNQEEQELTKREELDNYQQAKRRLQQHIQDIVE